MDVLFLSGNSLIANPRKNDLSFSLFTKFPEYMQYFNFAQLFTETNELMENKDFQAHCLTVMMAINTMIEYGLNDPPLLKSLVAKIGRNHFRRKLTSIPVEVWFC